ncbi:hypothetical protein OHAE_5065 [Ochrobactrum soli]|uniref:Uncharacterized protein n=1 Tax=Ochrobactrum soli TaxID=2448455 RepID=A0A2P9HDX2_9HYPH|nr:hypothetical protein OHAE_5065 [[Ochrobactrum] soli]
MLNREIGRLSIGQVPNGYSSVSHRATVHAPAMAIAERIMANKVAAVGPALSMTKPVATGIKPAGM